MFTMRILITTLCLIALLTSCTDDCEKEAQELKDNYEKALQYSNGNPASIQELKRQYNQAKANLDC